MLLRNMERYLDPRIYELAGLNRAKTEEQPRSEKIVVQPRNEKIVVQPRSEKIVVQPRSEKTDLRTLRFHRNRFLFKHAE